MKTIKVSKQSRTLIALLKKARRENVILRSPEGEEFILAEVDDFNREIELARENKKLMQLLEGRAKQKAIIPMDEARRQLNLDQT